MEGTEKERHMGLLLMFTSAFLCATLSFFEALCAIALSQSYAKESQRDTKPWNDKFWL